MWSAASRQGRTSGVGRQQRLRPGPVVEAAPRVKVTGAGAGGPDDADAQPPARRKQLPSLGIVRHELERRRRRDEVRARGVEGPDFSGQRRRLPLGESDSLDGDPDHHGRPRHLQRAASSPSTPTTTTACRRTWSASQSRSTRRSPRRAFVSPTGGAAAALPIEFRWNHVVNPQSSGYQLQIARDSGFKQIEQDIPFLNGPTYTVVQLPTGGTKFWRVRSFQGVIDTAGTAAVTAWSPVRDIRRPGRAAPGQLDQPEQLAPPAGQEVYVDLQLNRGAPPGGATINLASSNTQAAPLACLGRRPRRLLFRDLPLRHRAGGHADDGDGDGDDRAWCRRRRASPSVRRRCGASTACRSARTAASRWERS